MVGNKKYGTLLCNTIEDYSAEILGLNQKYMQNIATIQKQFLGNTNIDAFIENIT